MGDELDWITGKIREEKQDLPSQWMLTEYHNHLKRTGAESRGTQANYLKALRKILVEEDIDLAKIAEMSEEELKELNTEIADNIQNSKYRQSEGSDGKRRKRGYWSSWKKLLQVQGWKTTGSREYMPEIKFTKDQDTQKLETRPEDLPNRNQMKQFLKKLGQKSRPHIALRNQALAILLWDKGPRIGEALAIKIKDVSVNGKQVKVRIPGNKGSDTRKVEVFQGRKTLKDWIQKHPYRDNEDAYLFPIIQKTMPETKMKTNTSLNKKFHQTSNGLDFDTTGQPFHIFRKAMVTYHIVNEFATWEQICKWHGKKTDATKPDYLKMAVSDVDASVASSMGVDDEVDRERDNRMLDKPLLPDNCPSCDKLNRCYHETCQSCGTELPESQMPDNLETSREKMLEDISKEEVEELAKNNPEKFKMP